VHHDPGGNGGSGGGGGGYLTAERRFAGDGGAYGNDGGASGDECAASGKGQGTTTCEFGEGTLTSCKRGNAFAYSGGGGGGGGTVDYNTKSCCVNDNGGDSWAKDFCSNYSFPTNKAFKACSTCYGDGGYYNGTINIGGGQSGGLSNTPSYSGWSNVPANTGGGGGGGGARDLGSGGAGGSRVVIIRDAR